MDPKTAQKILKKVKKDYSIIACDFSISRERMWDELNILVKKYVKNNQKILDIGCGNGRLFSILKEKNVNYLGIDNCKELIEIARKKYKNYKNGKFKIQDLLEINFNKKFDLIFIIAVLQHIPSEGLRLKALKKIKKALKPDGYLLMLNWNLWQKDKIKYVEKYNALKLAGKSDLPARLHRQAQAGLDFNDTLISWKATNNRKIERYYHAFTRTEIKNLLKKAGFEIKDIYYCKKGKRSDVKKGYNLCTVAGAYS